MDKDKNPIQKTQTATQKVTASKPVRNYRALAFQTYLVIAVITFTVLAILAYLFPYFKQDLLISQTFQSIQIPGLLPLMQYISYWGYGPQMPILATLIIIFMLIIGLRWEAIVAVINFIGSGLITGVLKTLIGRGRPTEDLVNVVHNLNDKSFPSGHVLVYTAFFGFLFFLSYTLIKPSPLRTILLLIFGFHVALVGPSRVYLGEHWPSDIFGAYLMGSICLLISIYLYRWGKTKFFAKQPVAPAKT